LTVCVLIGTVTAHAQDTIPNPGFENWTLGGNYEDPDGWFTLNQGTSITGVETVTKTSDAHSGSYAIRLETKKVLTETVPGTAVAGVLNLLTLEVNPGFDIPGNPITLTGWHKYQPFLLDAGSIEVLLSKWNPALKIREPVGSGIFVQPLPINSYTSFTLDLIYTSSDTADTAIITLLSGSPTNSPGSVLFIDDLNFSFPPPLTVNIEDISASKDITAFPNPASHHVLISTPDGKAAYIELRDFTGRLVSQVPVSSDQTQVSVQELPIGNYTYLLVDETGNYIKKGKLIISR